MNGMQRDLEILWLSQYEYPKGTQLFSHAHEDYYQIFYILSGEADFVINGETYKTTRGMCVFIKPTDEHGISDARDADGADMGLIDVKFSVLNSKLRYDLDYIPAVSLGSNYLEGLFRLIHSEGVSKKPHYYNISNHLLCTALYTMLRTYEEYRPDDNGTSLLPKVTKKIKEYILEHFREDISLDDIAESVGYSKSHLCRIFKEDTKITINEYLNRVRVFSATELLENTEKDLAAVSSAVGFNNVFHFIKTFKKLIGIPPGNYRHNEVIGVNATSRPVNSASALLQGGIDHLSPKQGDGE